LLGLGVVAFWPGEREPEYNGKKLSDWLEVAAKGFGTVPKWPNDFDENASAEVKEAAVAIRSLGTNALPWLVKWTASDYGRWGDRLFKIFGALPRFLHGDYMTQSMVRNYHHKEGKALVGFAVLGPKAAPAVPRLITLLEKSKWQTSKIGMMHCLCALRATARPALPCLQTIAQNDKNLSFLADIAIRTIEGHPPRNMIYF
jgi:hypothetical protein